MSRTILGLGLALISGANAAAAGTADARLENATLEVRIAADDGAMTVIDKRAGITWTQRAAMPAALDHVVVEANIARLELRSPVSGVRWHALVELDAERPEMRVTVSGAGKLVTPLGWPHPFATGAGTYLIVPMGEGISFPAEDAQVPELRLAGYSGHGLSMPFYGVTKGAAAQLTVIETPDDFALRVARHAEGLRIVPEWEPQRGEFGGPRTLRLVFFERGGFVAMSKYYRKFAAEHGLVKTLREKRAGNPHVDLLVGAANIWCRSDEPLPIADEMLARGMTRLLWSQATSAENVAGLNARGLLTSSYDIYKDVMDPAVLPKLRQVHPLWPQEAWPDDLVLGQDGAPVPGWRVTGTDGKPYRCGNVCDLRATKYARRRIPADIARNPYRARFLDTVTATTLFECYHPEHPTTRTDSKRGRKDLLRYVAEEQKLVTGAENGMDFAVPEAHFFEGMMSLDAFRVPESGRNLQQIWETVPENVARFQVGHAYRLPLWELVYHDCVVANWFWGDYNNKLTPIWRQRDLLNILYATPPLYMFNADRWASDKERFTRSYHDIVPVVRAAGYAEMTDFRFLTEDRRVQQSQFSNGLIVTVNFGATDFILPEGARVGALGYLTNPPPAQPR